MAVHSSKIPQNSDETTPKLLTDKSRLLLAGLSLLSLFVLLPVFQFLDFSPYFYFKFGMNKTLLSLIVVCFGLAPIACFLAFVKFAPGKSKGKFFTRIMLIVSLLLFISQLFVTRLGALPSALVNGILFSIFAVGSLAIVKAPREIIWGLAWMSTVIIPVTFYHGYKQYLTIPELTRESDQRSATAKIDRHNIYMIFLDGCEITSAYLDSDKFPEEELMPNFRKFLIEDAQWFPNTLANSPITYLSFPTLMTGKLYVSKTNKYLADEKDITSILNSRYKINTFLFRETSTSFCIENRHACGVSKPNIYYQPMKILLETYGFISTFKLFPISFPIGRFHAHSYRRSIFVNHFFNNVETDPDKGNFYIIQLFDRRKTELKDFDKFFGDFIKILKKKGAYEDAVIVMMSDHGFNDGNIIAYGLAAKHDWPLYKVLFAIKTPGAGKGKIYKYKAQNIDVAPTLLARILPAEEYSRLKFDGVDVLRHRPAREHYINIDKEEMMIRLADKEEGDPEVIEVPLNQINLAKN